jgi:hypothetical protein
MPKEQYEAYYASCYAHYYAHYHATAALQQKQQQQQQLTTNSSAASVVSSQKASLLSDFVGLQDTFVGLDDVSLLLQPSAVATATASDVAVVSAALVSSGSTSAAIVDAAGGDTKDDGRKRKAPSDDITESRSDVVVQKQGGEGEGNGKEGEKEVEIDELLALLENSDKEDSGRHELLKAEEDEVVKEVEVEDVWTEHVDAESGATYYYNAATGESSWGAPPSEEEE